MKLFAYTTISDYNADRSRPTSNTIDDIRHRDYIETIKKEKE